jgi:tight adherence protein B
MFEAFDSIYIVYLSAFAAAIFAVEAAYLVLAAPRSYRNSVNHRLRMMRDSLDRESILLQLRRERGLDDSGRLLLPLKALNRLVLQSGVRIGIGRLALLVAGLALAVFAGVAIFVGVLWLAAVIALAASTLGPVALLVYLRTTRHRKFADQFPEAIDVIVRSLRAGHPVPVAISMVAREMPDPMGTEFGMVADEVTYGADLETAVRNLQFRVGQPDLHLFVTSIAIQVSTGGNLREILQNLAAVIRGRIKMRRKIKSVTSEARTSAMILTGLPPVFFTLMQILAPHFYGEIWDTSLVQVGLGGTAGWMLVGILLMYKMTKFRI